MLPASVKYIVVSKSKTFLSFSRPQRDFKSELKLLKSPTMSLCAAHQSISQSSFNEITPDSSYCDSCLNGADVGLARPWRDVAHCVGNITERPGRYAPISIS